MVNASLINAQLEAVLHFPLNSEGKISSPGPADDIEMVHVYTLPAAVAQW